MSKSYNKTIIIGRLGADPVKKDSRAVFPILNTTWDAEIHKEQVQRIEVYAVGKQTGIVMKYLRKGDLCCIEGKLDADFYSGKRDSICAERITFLSAKRASEVTSQEN